MNALHCTGVRLTLGFCLVSTVAPCSTSDFLRHFIEECNKANTTALPPADVATDDDSPSSLSGYEHQHSADDIERADDVIDESDAERYDLAASEQPASPAAVVDKPLHPPLDRPADSSQAPAAAAVTSRPLSAAATTRRTGKQVHPAPRPTATLCRSVPVVYSGHRIVKLGEICFQVPASVTSPSPPSSNSSMTSLGTGSGNRPADVGVAAVATTPSTKS